LLREEENLTEEQKALALETAREPHERREQLKEKGKTKRRQKETKGRKLRGPCDHRQGGGESYRRIRDEQ
jgi:hypothetical protein